MKNILFLLPRAKILSNAIFSVINHWATIFKQKIQKLLVFWFWWIFFWSGYIYSRTTHHRISYLCLIMKYSFWLQWIRKGFLGPKFALLTRFPHKWVRYCEVSLYTSPVFRFRFIFTIHLYLFPSLIYVVSPSSPTHQSMTPFLMPTHFHPFSSTMGQNQVIHFPTSLSMNE